MNNVIIKRDDFEKISLAAKKYITVKKYEKENAALKETCLSLQNENEALRTEKEKVEGDLKQLDYDFGVFYNSVSDEIELRDKNEKLSNQVHSLSADVLALKEENAVLKSEAAEKDNQLSAVNMELAESKSLLKTLQDKFDRVMKFIEQQRLKDKLEEFLKPVIHHKHSR